MNSRDCHHNPFEILFSFWPLSLIMDRIIEISIAREFKSMTSKGYESYIGCRYDKKGNMIASGVLCWRKRELNKK